MRVVHFGQRVQRSGRRFSIPRREASILNVHCGDKLRLRLRDKANKLLFDGVKTLKSGLEIYGARDVGKCVKRGQLIRVEARRVK